ncbi:MAG TPA: ABC transporter ATP-binding protein, partial [Actinomycetales bacterium]|nr:ABC transporter ATP-binding protein [Actinomycetales bacterium]
MSAALNVPADEPEIVCENLVRIYSTEGVEVQALQGLNLTVDPGEVVAIVGASGSGKSTLLNILSGHDKPTGGRAVVAGHDLTYMGARARVEYQRNTVGFVWQSTARNLLPYLSAVDNVMVPMMLAGSAAGGRERAMDLLESLGMGARAAAMPAELSGGEQQRVAIAVALANEPNVLLADEPTGALDRKTSAAVLDLMRETSEARGVTMVVVTHDPTVSEHVRRTVQIRDGRTSTEVLRRREVGADGVEVDVAEEFTVIDRSGRLQLPEHYVSDLGLRDRVRLSLEDDHAGVWPHDRAVNGNGAGAGTGATAGASPSTTGASLSTPEAVADIRRNDPAPGSAAGASLSTPEAVADIRRNDPAPGSEVSGDEELLDARGPSAGRPAEAGPLTGGTETEGRRRRRGRRAAAPDEATLAAEAEARAATGEIPQVGADGMPVDGGAVPGG